MALLSTATFAQTVEKDRINLKTGRTIKCTISNIDTVSMNILYSVMGQQDKVSIKEIASYTWNGEVNAGLPKKINNKVYAVNSDQPKQGNVNTGPLFIKFANQSQTGLGLMIAGNVISISSIFIKNEKDRIKETNMRNVVNAIGIGVSLTGTIVFIASFSNMRKAGEIVKIKDNLALGVCGDGIGITLKL